MKAYNQTWVENLYFKTKIDFWVKKGLLSGEQLTKTESEFQEDFYSPNWLIRIGLFIFTNIAISFSSGIFFTLLGLFDNTMAMAFTLIIFSIFGFLTLEYFIKNKNLYRSGIDNALLYAALGSLYFGILTIFDYSVASYIFPLILLIILSPALIRYADPLVTIGVFFSFFAFIFLFTNTFSLGKTLLPFVLMAFAVAIYFASKTFKDAIYYTDCQDIVEALALVVFYLAGNYYVVREANALLNNQSSSVEIPSALLFWVFTFAFPFLFIYMGIKTKERKSIVIGLLAIGFSVFTYRTYHSILPLEWALTIGGIVLIILSVVGLKYFKTPKYNLSSEAEELDKLQKLESIIIAQTFQSKPADDSMKFGGGQFGGGGADTNY